MRRRDLTLRSYRPENLPEMIEIWNQVVEQGDSFPQDTPLDAASAQAFFAAQTDTVCALDEGAGWWGSTSSTPTARGAAAMWPTAPMRSRPTAEGRKSAAGWWRTR